MKIFLSTEWVYEITDRLTIPENEDPHTEPEVTIFGVYLLLGVDILLKRHCFFFGLPLPKPCNTFCQRDKFKISKCYSVHLNCKV